MAGDQQPRTRTLADELNLTLDDYRTGRRSSPLESESFTYDRLRVLGRQFVDDYGLDNTYYDLFEKGAVLARTEEIPTTWDLCPQDLAALRTETDRKRALTRKGYTSLPEAWGQLTPMMKLLIFTCGLGAATQGWNETATNGANFFFRTPLELQDVPYLYSLFMAAPYAASGALTFLLMPIFNFRGRRMAIGMAAAICCVSCILQATATSFHWMLAFRFLLGVGIGVGSATIPVFAAETVPAHIRGTIVMLWQVCTAFGILIGLIVGFIFYNVGGVKPQPKDICGKNPQPPQCVCYNLLSMRCTINWRLMIGSPMLLPLFIIPLLICCQESPRWCIKRRKYRAAFASLCKLRHSNIQAARGLFYMHCLLHVERSIGNKQNRYRELLTVRRNYRALLASVLVLVMQQKSGINAIIYYSSEIIAQSNRTKPSSANQPQKNGTQQSVETKLHLVTNTNLHALAGSIGIGVINVVCALPAFRWIDTKGRRFLLLVTFPFMAAFMFWIGMASPKKNSTEANTGLVLSGMYLFTAFYSFGEGPVPFAYSAECHALYLRERAMAVAVSINWTLNFVVSFTWPLIADTWGPRNGFFWYMAWNIIGFFLVLFFVPETRGRTLEELDQVFGCSVKQYLNHGVAQATVFVRNTFFRQDIPTPMMPYDTSRRRIRTIIKEPSIELFPIQQNELDQDDQEEQTLPPR